MTAAIDLHWVQKPGTRMRSMLRPATLLEALEMLTANPELRPVAGGTDLVLELARSGSGGDADLLDLTHVAGFSILDFEQKDHISIGAGVTHADILASELAAQYMLALAQACLEIGSPQLRNRATVVGNLVTASPANDSISALMALDATVVIAGLATSDTGAVVERQVKLVDFYSGFRSTVLEAGELVVRLLVPQPMPRQRSVFVKAGLRKAQAISVVHAGFSLDFDADGAVTAARIALGSVGPTVALSDPAAQVLIGSRLTPATIERAAAAAVDSVAPIDDGRATAEYRSNTVRIVVSRALSTLAAGSERDRWPARIPLLSMRHRTDMSADPPIAPASPSPVRTEIRQVSIEVHGESLSHEPVGPGTLLDWLREAVGPGTKEGCAEGECGACTVHLNGDAVMSCLVPAAQAHGASVVTIEGLGTELDVHPMKQAFVDKFAVQCGYCIPGFIMAAQRLAEEFETMPTREEIELALSGNLCRCTGYYNIIDAVQAAIAGELA